MSMFGKVLTILNILGAVGLLAIAGLDYGKRQQWTYAVERHDVALLGIPVSDQERNSDGTPRVDLTSPGMLQDVFSGAGQPVPTQTKEVERVRAELDAKINAASDKNTQLALYARYLLPFATTNLQREKFSSLQAHLANAQTIKDLKEQLKAAHAQAQAAARADANIRFADAFNQAVLALPGEPRKPFADALLVIFATQPAKPFDDAFTEALDALHGNQKAALDGLFQDALQTETTLASGQKKERSYDEQRKVIAHLLFNLIESAPPEAIAGQPAAAAPIVMPDILSIEAYRRFLAVVGLQSAVREINAQAQVMLPIMDELIQSIAAERHSFVLAHEGLLSQVRDLAEKLEKAKVDLDKVKEQAVKQEELVKKRLEDVKNVKADYVAAQALTMARLSELREMSKALYNIRIEVREATAENQNRVQKIAELERTRTSK